MRDKKSYKQFKKYSKGGDLDKEEGEFSHIIPVQAEPLEVKVYGNEFERALKIFRSKVQKERILSNFKQRQRYEKPSDKKRRKRAESARKRLETEGKEKYERE